MSDREGLIVVVAEAIFARHAAGQDFSANLRDYDLRTQEYWEGQADAAITCIEAVDVIGFQVQCDCGQQALVATQPSGDWVCPRCAELAESQPSGYTIASVPALRGADGKYVHKGAVESGHDIGLSAAVEAAAAMFPQHRARAVQAEPDDEWPLSKVRG